MSLAISSHFPFLPPAFLLSPQGDGSLAPGLRCAVSCLARGADPQTALIRGQRELVVREGDWAKLSTLQRVHRVLVSRPWLLSARDIQDLCSVGLSVSEIIHSLLLMAHFHALSGASPLDWIGRLTSPHDPGLSASLGLSPGTPEISASPASLLRRRKRSYSLADGQVGLLLRPVYMADWQGLADQEQRSQRTWGPGDGDTRLQLVRTGVRVMD